MMEFGARPIGRMQIDDDDHLVLSRQHLVSVDFGDRRLAQFSAEGCRFERCRFDGAVIESASFGAGRVTSEYVSCTFDGAKLAMGPGGYARFTDCSFEGTLIDGWFCYAVELVDCTFTGRLKKVVFNGSVPSEKQDVIGRRSNQFEGNDFSRATLIDVGFRTGIDLTKQRLPTADDYVLLDDAPAAVRRARAAFDAWGDPVAKKQVRGVLAVMEEDVAVGQAQLLIRVADYPRSARPAILALLAAAQAA